MKILNTTLTPEAERIFALLIVKINTYTDVYYYSISSIEYAIIYDTELDKAKSILENNVGNLYKFKLEINSKFFEIKTEGQFHEHNDSITINIGGDGIELIKRNF